MDWDFILLIALPFLPVAIGLIALAIVLQRRNRNGGLPIMGRLSKQIDPERLRVVHRSGSGFSQIREIVEDTRTGEQYFIITSGWTVTVTPLNVKK